MPDEINLSDRYSDLKNAIDEYRSNQSSQKNKSEIEKIFRIIRQNKLYNILSEIGREYFKFTLESVVKNAKASVANIIFWEKKHEDVLQILDEIDSQPKIICSNKRYLQNIQKVEEIIRKYRSEASCRAGFGSGEKLMAKGGKEEKDRATEVFGYPCPAKNENESGWNYELLEAFPVFESSASVSKKTKDQFGDLDKTQVKKLKSDGAGNASSCGKGL